MTTLTLPYPPSSNRYWRNFRGRMVRSAEAQAYKIEVGWICNMASHLRLHEGNVRLTVHLYRPARRGDLDNTLKVLVDSLIGYLYTDDDKIIEIHAYRHDDKTNPRAEVEITEVAG